MFYILSIYIYTDLYSTNIAFQSTDWHLHHAALLKYGKQHGHCNVPCNHSYTCVLEGLGENGSDYAYSGNLGGWVRRQRSLKNGTQYANSKLEADREALLQKLVDQGRFD